MSEYRPEKKRITVSVGESVRIIRELQELSQNQLSELTGIPQSTISAIENDRARLGGARESSGSGLEMPPRCPRLPRLGTSRGSCGITIPLLARRLDRPIKSGLSGLEEHPALRDLRSVLLEANSVLRTPVESYLR
jgi:hypothetical protein